MHPALNYRQSRRSACDRCRGFKLRCERDQVDGRSCERCLKAQVICTTSINHPSNSYGSSKSGSRSLSADFDPRFLTSDRWSMPILHKSSNLKVKKPMPTGGFRKHENQRYNSWPCSDSLYSWTPGAFPPLEGDLGIQMASCPAPSFSFDRWGEQQSQWAGNTYPVVSTENFSLKLDHCLDNQLSASGTLMSQPSYLHDVPHINTESAIPPQSLTLLSSNSLPVTDDSWMSSWPRITEITEEDKEQIESFMDWMPTTCYDLRKKILKLNMELTDDLERLEMDSGIFRFSPLLGSDIAPSIEKLDLPVFRTLNYSTKFLGLLRSLKSTPQTSTHIVPSIELPQTDLGAFDDTRLLSLDSLDNNLEDGAATASSHDSGYHTMATSPSDQGRSVVLHKCDLSTSLSMLTAYLQLIRLYQIIFNRLYQFFLITPPDAILFLALPSIQFGQFHMNGNLAMQMQSLVDFSSNILAKLEQALGLSSGLPRGMEGNANPMATVLGNGVLTSVQDHIMAQEHMECGMSLKETMNCLRKFAMDSVCA
ncbi:hypothetical protein N7478_003620 [Penicillium angulare]|uniref:uncharacterized protein n=1 Tax=Penicillium angulare TaxID=116970 RepID=UPI00254111A2|nr:uncharacterized protein N7478_003620 [Penicillium angulare]KAJ5287934.1 hypothetical protein N7478_003620 [Penicillium angulare]